MSSISSPSIMSAHYRLSGPNAKKQPSVKRPGLGSTDQVTLSSKGHLGNRQPLMAQKLGSPLNRSASVKTQAVLNPFAAARNPVSEKQFKEVLADLAPLAPALKNLNEAERKALYKQTILNCSQLLSEINQLRGEGRSAELIAYREGEQPVPESYLPPVLGKNGKPVQTLRRINLPYPPHNLKISNLDDVLGCVAANLILSMLFSPQVIIGGPLSVKLEQAGASAKNQGKDAQFYLKGLLKNKKAFDADFEALNLSNAEKKQLKETAQFYERNVDRNDALRDYTKQVFEVMSQAAGAVRSHSGETAQAPVKIGLVSSVDKDYKRALKDVTHLFTGENA